MTLGTNPTEEVRGFASPGFDSSQASDLMDFQDCLQTLLYLNPLVTTPVTNIMVGFLIVSECESRFLARSGRRHTLRRNLSDHNICDRCIFKPIIEV